MRIFVVAAAALLLACSPPGNGQDAFVKAFLTDPDSVQFRNVYQSRNDKTVWCGEFNARNRMGGMVGFTRYVLQTPHPGLGINPDVDTENARVFATMTIEGADGFTGKWSVWCRL